MPRVSVVIPAYRSRKFIEEAIDSVLKQTFTDVELLVIDDGCPEETGKFVTETYGDRAAGRLRVLHQENRGPSVARNRGIQEARGEWIAFLDADDYWEPEKLEVQLELAATCPEYGLICSSYFKDERGKYLERHRKGKSGRVFPDVFMANFIRTSTVMIRRDCFDTVGLFDTDLPLTQDYDLWLRMSREYPVGYIDRPLATYRHHPAGISRKSLESREYFLKILDKNYDPERIPESLYRRRIAYVHYHLGRHCRRQRLRDRAREHFRDALRLRPAAPQYWLAYLGSFL